MNLQHSKFGTANLMQITEEESTDIFSIQEPYKIQNKVFGIPNKYRNFTIPMTRSRAALVVTIKHIDALLLKQHPDADSVVAEKIADGKKTYLGQYVHRHRPANR